MKGRYQLMNEFTEFEAVNSDDDNIMIDGDAESKSLLAECYDRTESEKDFSGRDFAEALVETHVTFYAYASCENGKPELHLVAEGETEFDKTVFLTEKETELLAEVPEIKKLMELEKEAEMR